MTATHPAVFYVWSDDICDFDAVATSDVICPECSAPSHEMNIVRIDRIRDGWMLECACGEQFYNLND